MWIARDKQGYLVLFSYCKPTRNEEKGIWICEDNKCREIPSTSVWDCVTWETEPLEVTINQTGKLLHKIYRIWCIERYNSGGFSDTYDEPTSMIFSTYEEAKKECPRDSFDNYGGSHKYYIKEETI